jgi:hypothetical protein
MVEYYGGILWWNIMVEYSKKKYDVILHDIFFSIC